MRLYHNGNNATATEIRACHVTMPGWIGHFNLRRVENSQTVPSEKKMSNGTVHNPAWPRTSSFKSK
jgi:hypothetical protein